VNDTRQLLSTARLAADRAAVFLRSREGSQRPDRWSEKARADFVTEVDRAAEQLIADTLHEAVPEGRIVGEELTPSAPGPLPGGLVWIVDPLDGTTNFLHGFPEYAVSIAAALDGELVAGVVVQVPYGHVYEAERGRGARLDGRPLAVSAISEPRHALVGTGFPFRDIGQLDLYQRHFAAVVRGTAGLRRPGSAALDLCHVAAGRFEAFWELRLAPWDVAAGALMVREAGGVVTDLEGRPDVLCHGSIVAGNPALHSWLRQELQTQR
jgi:myo-inositol-1(or 4)-monophosphatase